MRAIIFFACFVLVYADTTEQNPDTPETPQEKEALTVIVKEHEAVTLFCNFTHNDKGSYRWEKINGTQRTNVTNEGKSTKSRHNGSNVEVSLEIKNVTLEDAGTYFCSAVNPDEAGQTDSRNLTVTNDADLTINSVEASELAGSVDLTWSVKTGSYQPNLYQIECITNSTRYFCSEVFPGPVTKYQATWLTNDTDYRFRIHGLDKNSIRISPYSNLIHTAWKDKVGFELNVSITNLTENSFTVTWNSPAKEMKVEYYQLDVGKNFHKKITTGRDVIVEELKNLTCSTNYTVDVAGCSSTFGIPECRNRTETIVRTLNCGTNSAAGFSPQINTITVMMFALYFAKKYYV